MEGGSSGVGLGEMHHRDEDDDDDDDDDNDVAIEDESDFEESEEDDEENEDLSSAESSGGGVAGHGVAVMSVPMPTSDGDASSANSTPPLPPTFSPGTGSGMHAAAASAASASVGGSGGSPGGNVNLGNLDDFFSQPAPRDIAANSSTLGATSPVASNEFGVFSSPGMRNGLGMGLSTAEDIIERSERVVPGGGEAADDEDDLGNLQDFEIGEQEDDGLVGTTPTTAQARAGHPGIANIGGLLGLSPSEAKTPLGSAGMHLTGTPTQLPRPLSTGRRRMGTAPGEPSPFDDSDDDGGDDDVAADGLVDDDGDFEGDEEEGGEVEEDELDPEQQKMAEELGMFGDAGSVNSSVDSLHSFNGDVQRAVDAHNMQNKKRQKEQAERRHQEQALDEIESFPVRSWSGRKRFAQSWDEDVVAMPEAPPNAPRDPWRSPASKSRGGGARPELQRHEEVEEEDDDDDEEEEDDDIEDDDDDDIEDDLEEDEDLDLEDHFEERSVEEEEFGQPNMFGGSKSIGAELLMGSEKVANNDGLDVSPIASPRRPLADSTNAQSLIFPSESAVGADGDVRQQRKPSRLPRRRKKTVGPPDLMDEEDERRAEAEKNAADSWLVDHGGIIKRNVDPDRVDDEDDVYADMHEGAWGSGVDAEQKHRQMLDALGEEKRRQRAEEEERKERREKRRRKKNQQLLERAKVRQRGGVEAQFLAPTKAAEQQRIERKEEKQLTPEEQEALEVEKFARMAQVRKQFKYQHKKHLASLVMKRRSDVTAKVEAELEEEERIKKIRERGLRRARKRKQEMQMFPPVTSNNRQESSSNQGSAEKTPRSLLEKVPTSNKSDDDHDAGSIEVADGATAATDGRATPRGSAVAAVRAVRRSTSAPPQHGTTQGEESDDMDQQDDEHNYAAGELEAEMLTELSPEEKAERKRRAREMKVAKERQQGLLNRMAEETKRQKAEDDKKKARMQKRAQIKRDRILSEAAERKRVLAEEARLAGTESLIDDITVEAEAKKGAVSKQTVADRAAAAAARRAAADKLRTGKLQGAEGAENTAEELDEEEKKMKHEAQKSAVMRLHSTKKKADEGIAPAARDYNDWKRKNGVPLDAKVFSMTGWYPCVKQALLDRGWYFNSDRESFFFDLKWTLRSNELKQEQLQPWQLTNHFMKNVAITTKVGLARSLKHLSWHDEVECDDIFPRCYDLNSPVEMQSFLDDYRNLAAQSILKEVISTSKSGEASNLMVNTAVLDVAMRVARKQAFPSIDTDEYLDDMKATLDLPVTDLEWEVLGHAMRQQQSGSTAGPSGAVFRKWDDRAVGGVDYGIFLADKVPKPIDGFLRVPTPEPEETKDRQRWQRERRRRNAGREAARNAVSKRVAAPLEQVGQERLDEAVDILEALEGRNAGQYSLNGRFCSKNFWIVKPSAKSRGRGIMTFRDVDKLLEYVEVGEKGASALWVVQKYMENPLVIAKRKFDIRQWVLVTNWNPLTIYFYDECYARFSAAEYSEEDSDLDNQHIHLVNNSISKNSDAFHDKIIAENGVEIQDCMWSMAQLAAYMQYNGKVKGVGETMANGGKGEDVFSTRCKQRMRDIAKHALMCAQGAVEARQNSWELYGYDFMIDDQFRPWLIEINSSPACDYSTHVTEDFVPRALADVIKVVVDLREWEAAKAKDKSAAGEKPSIGGWENIYKGQFLETQKTALGLDLVCSGTQIQKPSRRSNSNNFASSASSLAARSSNNDGKFPVPPSKPRPSQQPTNPRRQPQTVPPKASTDASDDDENSSEADESKEGEDEEEDDDDDDDDDGKAVGSNAAITPKSAEVTPSSSPSKISPKADEAGLSAVPVLPIRAAQGKQPPRWTLKHAIMNSPRALRKHQEDGEIDEPASARKLVNQEPSPPIAAVDGATTTMVAVGDFDVDDNGSIDYDDI